MNAWPAVLLSALPALALAAQSPAPPSPAPTPSPARDVALERLQWTKAVDGADPITAIEVRNDFGDVRARLAGDRTAEAWMVVQRLDAKGEKVGFTVERRGGTVAIVVGYPPGRVRDADPFPAKDSYDRLDLVVFVPEGVVFRAHTLRGQVEARGLKSDVEAATLDGPIFVRTAGLIQARSGSGEITALPDAAVLASPGPPLLLQTVSGPIVITLPPGSAPEVRIETGGRVESPLALQRAAAGPRTVATLAPAAPPARLLLASSQRGLVRIERDDP